MMIVDTEQALLKCAISEGMFPEERAVKIVDFGGDAVEMFASSGAVKGNKIQVTVLKRNDQGAAWVSLPGTPFNSGSVIVVKSSDLAALDATQ